MNLLPVAKVADTAGDLYRSSKTLTNTFKYIETAKDTLKTAGRTTLNKVTTGVNRVLDAPLLVGRQFATAGGPTIGTSPTLRELGQNTKSTMTSLFVRHGDELRATSDEVVSVRVSKSKYPEATRHIEDAQKSGQPDTLTINRNQAKQNRRESLRDIAPVRGTDRDEYPPAMFSEGGKGSSVRHISPKDNRGTGSSIGNQLKKYPDGTRVRIDIVD